MKILYFLFDSKLLLKNVSKTIEIFKRLYYYKYSKNPKKSRKEAQNMKEVKTFAGVEREREREPQH